MKRSLRNYIKSPHDCYKSTGLSRRTVYSFLAGEVVMLDTFLRIYEYASSIPGNQGVSKDELLELWKRTRDARVGAH